MYVFYKTNKSSQYHVYIEGIKKYELKKKKSETRLSALRNYNFGYFLELPPLMTKKPLLRIWWARQSGW